MKIYFNKPEKLIRVNIKSPGHDTEHLMFYDCELLECAQKLMDAAHYIVEQKDDEDAIKVVVQCREWANSTNGASCSFPVYHVTPSMMKQLFLVHFGYGTEIVE